MYCDGSAPTISSAACTTLNSSHSRQKSKGSILTPLLSSTSKKGIAGSELLSGYFRSSSVHRKYLMPNAHASAGPTRQCFLSGSGTCHGVNAGSILQRLAGVKVQQGRASRTAPRGGPSCLLAARYSCGVASVGFSARLRRERRLEWASL